MKNQSLGKFEELGLLMEEKGFVKADFGGITEDRGERRKKLYVITAFGKQVLYNQYILCTDLYQLISKMSVSQ